MWKHGLSEYVAEEWEGDGMEWDGRRSRAEGDVRNPVEQVVKFCALSCSFSGGKNHIFTGSSH